MAGSVGTIPQADVWSPASLGAANSKIFGAFSIRFQVPHVLLLEHFQESMQHEARLQAWRRRPCVLEEGPCVPQFRRAPREGAWLRGLLANAALAAVRPADRKLAY